MASLADCQIIHPMESHGADLTPKSLKFGDTLSTEIWVMILELVAIDEQFVEKPTLLTKPYHLRLVSKRFNAIATPIIYREFALSNKLVASRPDLLSSRIITILKACTRKLFVSDRDAFNVYRVPRFLAECRALRDLSWSSWICYTTTPCLPRSMQIAFRHELVQVRLHLTIHNTKSRTLKFEGVPTANLASLEVLGSMLYCEPRDHKDFTALVVASNNLKVLEMPRYAQFSTSYGRLPAMKRLVVPDAWFYTPEEVAKIWDFSRLTSLVLRWDVDIPSFVDSVHGNTFSALGELEITQREENSRQGQEASSSKLSDFISRVGGRLQKVSVETYHPTTIINSLSNHKENLVSVSISTPDQDEPSTIITPKEVREIVLSLPYLVELDINCHVNIFESRDSDAYHARSSGFIDKSLEVLATLKYLRRLSLRYIASDAKILFHSEFASDIVQHLQTNKQGVSLQQLCIVLETASWEERDFEYRAHYEWNAAGKLSSSEFSVPEMEDTSNEDSD